MTANRFSFRCRARWVRRRLRHWHDTLAPAARKRIALGAFMLLVLVWGWFLFYGMPDNAPAIRRLQFVSIPQNQTEYGE